MLMLVTYYCSDRSSIPRLILITNECLATGPNNEGCPAACNYEPYGCCDDEITPAHGPNKEGCCLNTVYGCCPDNILSAQGPNLEGNFSYFHYILILF